MTHPIRAAVTALVLLFAYCSVACAGFHARQNALLPPVQLAWSRPDGIRENAERSAAAEPDPQAAADDVAQADAAITVGDPVLMALVPWSAIDDMVAADIARRIAMGEISLGVGDSYRERLLQFQGFRTSFLQGVSR